VEFVDSWDGRLRSVALEMDRAMDQQFDLVRGIVEYFDGAFETYSHFDQYRSEFVIEIEMKREPPAALGLIVRDCIQAIRSALDRLVWELIIHRGIEKPGSHTHFPITLNQKQFAKQIAMTKSKSGTASKGQLHGLLATDIEAIRGFQPYQPLGSRRPDGLMYPVNAHPLHVLAQTPNDYERSVVHIPSTMLGGRVSNARVNDLKWLLRWNADAGIIEQADFLYPRLTLGQRAIIARALLSHTGTDPHVELRSLVATILFTERELEPKHLALTHRAAVNVVEGLTPLFSL
jgi:hypothetical protein